MSSTINRQEFLSKRKTRALSLMLAARNTMLGTFRTNLAYLKETAGILAEAETLR